ncbi:DUF6186 family protein [Catenulispora pinisilvae]|uniref:DUF6186 family protein n=1 Tax=Catenulispora pinisilvae TaxID=2705253 RepID=UPI001890B928|nr:DUF6186 family protein [Catenulispora pinisilvae]
MSPRAITVTGYVVIGAAALLVEVVARRPGSRVPTFSQLLSHVMHEKWGRVGMLLAWWWLGFHFLSRS